MLKKISGSLLIACSVILYSCSGSAENKESAGSDTTATSNSSESEHTSSLREACEKLAKAESERDTVTSASLLDSNFSITARGQTFESRAAFRAYMKTQKTDATSPVHAVNTYNIEKVETGSEEPVWAGYDRGTFTNTATSDDGSYNRKVSGPYYRAWKLVDGQWKCYHITLMAFSCDGNDCKE